MKRRLKWAVVGGVSCAAAALVVTMVISPATPPTGTPILVPQGQDSELALPKTPTTSVSALPPLETETSPATTTTTPPPTAPTTTTPAPPASRPPAPPPPKTTTPRPAGVDFQAENALIRSGTVESNHPGFTGTGFVDTDNTAGSFVQWTVNASRTGDVDVIFRFANGSNQLRPMDITLNGILVASLDFPSTGSFETYRTVTVRMSVLGGTNRIRATSQTDNGGPNLDKITVV